LDKVLAIAVPTCSQRVEDIRIGYVLEALALQPASSYYDKFEIYIWDEGPVPMTASSWVPLALDLLVLRGHSPTYLRRGPSRGVAHARRELLAAIPDRHQHILMLDDDLLVMPDAISQLCEAAASVGSFGFIQGAKIELDKRRTYQNDINQLTAFDATSQLQRIWFGDAAFLLVSRAALRHVQWDLVTRFAQDGLAGEDVAISLMISDHEPCYGLSSAAGYHMSLGSPRWSWEIHSDVLQFELLRDVVSPETLARALPHLARHPANSSAEPQEELTDDTAP